MKHVPKAWLIWFGINPKDKFSKTDDEKIVINGDSHLELARSSLQKLLKDRSVPELVREKLKADYQQLHSLLEKIEHGHIYIAVFGRVSVGKSAILNTLLGENRFKTSPLHGETKKTEREVWTQYDTGGIFLIDTPGINEIQGEEREKLAYDVASRCDLVIFVLDSDITNTELQALKTIKNAAQRLILVLNKVDRYTKSELHVLLDSISRRTVGLVNSQDIVTTAAMPTDRVVIMVDKYGKETETRRSGVVLITALREKIWDILSTEGKTMIAINAGIFASRFSDRLSREIIVIRRELADTLVRKYCVLKGITVALNPVPLTDILAAAVTDVAMLIHLSKIYNIPLNTNEIGDLIKNIIKQLTLLAGTIWGMQIFASLLKGLSLGLSTLVTATAQGTVAWYSTYIIGKAAEQYFLQGKSWGIGGPKKVVKDILNSLDRDSLLSQAREEIISRLRTVS